MGLLDFAVFSIAFLPLAVRVGELGLDGLILDIGYLLDWRWWACVGGIGCLYGLHGFIWNFPAKFAALCKKYTKLHPVEVFAVLEGVGKIWQGGAVAPKPLSPPPCPAAHVAPCILQPPAWCAATWCTAGTRRPLSARGVRARAIAGSRETSRVEISISREVSSSACLAESAPAGAERASAAAAARGLSLVAPRAARRSASASPRRSAGPQRRSGDVDGSGVPAASTRMLSEGSRQRPSGRPRATSRETRRRCDTAADASASAPASASPSRARCPSPPPPRARRAAAPSAFASGSSEKVGTP